MGILFILMGIFTVFCTITKPNFYWNSRKALRFRKLIGDFGATVFYCVVGSGLVVFGIFYTIQMGFGFPAS